MSRNICNEDVFYCPLGAVTVVLARGHFVNSCVFFNVSWRRINGIFFPQWFLYQRFFFRSFLKVQGGWRKICCYCLTKTQQGSGMWSWTEGEGFLENEQHSFQRIGVPGNPDFPELPVRWFWRDSGIQFFHLALLLLLWLSWSRGVCVDFWTQWGFFSPFLKLTIFNTSQNPLVILGSFWWKH